MRQVLFTVITALVVAGCLSAPRYDADFSALDANLDQIIEWHEFKAYYPTADPKAFLQADHDKNGAVTGEEWRFFIAVQGS